MWLVFPKMFFLSPVQSGPHEFAWKSNNSTRTSSWYISTYISSHTIVSSKLTSYHLSAIWCISLYHPIREGNLLLISYKPPFPLSAEQLIDLARLHSDCCLLLTMGAAGRGDGDVETRRRFAAPPKFRIFFLAGEAFVAVVFVFGVSVSVSVFSF